MINLFYLFRFNTCGYYCLKYILKKVKVVNKKYMSLYEIGNILKSRGYFYNAYKNICLDEVKDECITLLKVNDFSYHYIVLKCVTLKYVYYYDPLFLFVRKKKRVKFEKKWFNTCLFYYKK